MFLFAPAGATLKCWLIAGNQRREATHAYEQPGAFGRTNFCRFDAVIDVDEDVVLLALDIDEAHQDVIAKEAHPVVAPGDTRTQAQIEGSLPEKVDSVVKLQRVPGRTVQGLEDTRILPSLWTAKPLGEVSKPPDNFHPFSELKQLTKSQPLSRKGRDRGEKGKDPFGSSMFDMASTTTQLPGGSALRSDSMHSLPDPSLEARASLASDDTPLPRLSRSHSGTGSNGAPRQRRSGVGRRARDPDLGVHLDAAI